MIEARKLLRLPVLNLAFKQVEDVWVARCLEIPGCISEGDSLEQAKANIHDAIEVCLSVILEDALAARVPVGRLEEASNATVEIVMPHVAREQLDNHFTN